MNGEEQFERQLQSHPQRKIPASWREEILGAAKAAVPRQASPAHRASGTSGVISWLTGLLWPAPRAWAGLATVWLMVLVLNFTSDEPSRGEPASRGLPPSPQMRELLRQQEELFAELAGPRGTTEATKRPVPQPQSQRREQCDGLRWA